MAHNDCDGTVDEGCPVDADGDGTKDDTDCDDTQPTVHPSHPEVCDGLDNDCDGDLVEGDVCGRPVGCEAAGAGFTWALLFLLPLARRRTG